MAKRKMTSEGGAPLIATSKAIPIASSSVVPPKVLRRGSSRKAAVQPANVETDPDNNPEIRDGKTALRASPDAEEPAHKITKKGRGSKVKREASESSLSELSGSQVETLATPATKKAPAKRKRDPDPVASVEDDPEADGQEDADPDELKAALSRPQPVNSSYLPLPWKGRLGYACLNTYLRTATPPVFSSRTCRIASILEHRHPLKDPSQPEHATKNRPDKGQPADVARGQAYVEALGVANARDIPKMLRWNDKYGIKFFRLSSEMFPFASHDLYGYKLTPFASEVLAEAGKVAAELGHRLTTHPGQFTQLGSPRPEVITASIRDLDYHCELLDLLKLPPQQDRDAVMILHMGGVFGDKQATIQRFKENYVKLPQKVKDRLVLENDDVCYTVHDILPVCEELNIPMVLDYHHHNILFDETKIREGTLDIMSMYDRIKATWDRKGIKQKMHYSEPCPGAVTGRQRRKHNPRPYSLPPCAQDMDLMIEAKDKEQAVFEMMRNFRLPGHEKINDVIPYIRTDENKPWKAPKKKSIPKKKKAASEDAEAEEEPEAQPPAPVPEEEIAMGGPENRVYWPVGFEEWLRPKKREVKPRDPEKAKSTAEKAAQRRAEKAAWQAAREASADCTATAGAAAPRIASATASEAGDTPSVDVKRSKSVYDKVKETKAKPARAPSRKKQKVAPEIVLTPSPSEEEESDISIPDVRDNEEAPAKAWQPASAKLARRQSARGNKNRAIKYTEMEEDE